MQRRQLMQVVRGGLLGLLALGFSGRLFDAAGMPPYPGDGKSPRYSPQMAAAVAKYDSLRAGFKERGICQPGGLAQGAHVTGTFHILAICVDFSDKIASTPSFKFDTLIFGVQAGTVHDFYREITYGSIDMVTVNLPSSLGWQRLPQTYAYYVNNNYGLGTYPHNTQKLTEDLADLIDPLVNFANYDNDGDGYVDGLVIVHAGRGAEFSGQLTDIWSHKWGISPRLKDGVYVSAYSIQPEYWTSPGDITIGVYAHEIGHLFGLPDLYDVDGSSRGIGRWSLMANGAWNGTLGSSPAHMDAWCKYQAGFLTPTNVGGNTSGAVLPRVEDSPTVFRLWANGAVGNQYFLIENRQKFGYDTGLPSAGLLIWHIDDTQGSNTNEWYPGHTSSGHYWVALEQADALWELEQNTDYGDTGDPFPGSTSKTTFSAATTPNSNDYTGTPTYVTVTNISPSGSTMTCDFMVSLVADVLDDHGRDDITYTLDLSNAPNPFNPATTISYTTDGTQPVTLDVFNILGARVAGLVSGASTPGTHQIVWDGRDDHGQGVASGVYLARLDTGRSHVTRKMVLIR
ncbi:MAG: M6 family metalloprotease domain-containing protein [candidate division Zixibacteria bacterium]|nr:M6 family metalloprotease domain-containing protein [candidate division Zixibacteria bacterium]